MDLYGVNPTLRKGLSDRSHTQSGPHSEISKQFANNDILSSSAWSSVIHQPAQDSEPEDLPSTVDIDAIKEPPTPINASAQTPAEQLHGESNSFELSDDQNDGDSGSDSDSDSESGNSENEAENADTGADSGSCSDSESVSSRRSSSSSNGKHPSARSSRSNTPPSNSEDNQQRFSVQETNFEQGGLKLRLSALKLSSLGSEIQSGYRVGEDAENSSDSSESKFTCARKKPKCDPLTRGRQMYSLKLKDDYKMKMASCNYRAKDKSKFDSSMYDRDSDSESSSSSNTSPAKPYSPTKSKERATAKATLRFDAAAVKLKSAMSDPKSHGEHEEKYDRSGGPFGSRRNEAVKNASKDRLGSVAAHSKCRKTVYTVPSLRLPQTCKLSEDSDDSSDTPKLKCENETKKENSRDTIEKLAQQLTQPGNSSEHLQVLNEEDLASVLRDVDGATSGPFDPPEGSGKKKSKIASDKKATEALSDSSSDAEMLSKQIVRDAINSIHVDSDVSDDSDDSSAKNRSSDDDSSSDDDERGRRKDKAQYSSNLLEAFVEKTEQLNKNTAGKRSGSSQTLLLSSSSDKASNQKKVSGVIEPTRKRGRPPKSKISSMAEIEAYMRLDCTISNVSPDSGIQSNSGSPLYHSVPSPAVCNSTSRSSGLNVKHNAVAGVANSKSLSLSQKALLSACKKNPYQSRDSKERRQTLTTGASKIHTTQSKISTNESSTKGTSRLAAETLLSSRSCKSAGSVSSSRLLDDALKVPPYLGSKRSSSPAPNVAGGSPARNNLALFQEKRGPGRPKKHTPAKLNGQTSVERLHTDRVDPRRLDGKPFELAASKEAAAVVVVSNGKPKRPKYASPVVAVCLESSPKKRDKKRNTPAGHSTALASSLKMAPAFVPPFPTRKEWLRKHKKRKKKDAKEKSADPALLKEVDSLTEVFSRKCVIEDRKSLVDVGSQFSHSAMRSKGAHRVKDRSKKRKHSDRESESESNSVISILASDTKTKRRHKKNAIETPKVPATNCDQRLPLKKRHYHISASSTSSNGHQSHEAKTRTEKHSSEPSRPSALTAAEPISKPLTKAIAVLATTTVKSADNHKVKSETPRIALKSEAATIKSSPKTDQTKHSSKATDSHKSAAIKLESVKPSSKPDMKTATKTDGVPAKKTEDVAKPKKQLVEIDGENSPLVTPKKRHRLDAEKEIVHKTAVSGKTADASASLPLRRSGRSSNVVSREPKKSSGDASKPNVADSKRKMDSKENNSRVAAVESIRTSERSAKTHAKQSIASANKRHEKSDSGPPSAAKRVEKTTGDASSAVPPSAVEPVNAGVAAQPDKLPEPVNLPLLLPPTLSSAKKEKCRKSTKDADIDTPPVLDEFGGGEVTALPPPLATSMAAMPSPSKQPQLITPLPSEPATPPTASPGLKPPAGVFEPTRKLPSLSRCKKNSINDVLSMLTEKLKVLESPLEKATALIEKMGGAAATAPVNDEDAMHNERVLRSKRASAEKENTAAKKSRVCTDVTIRLPKLQSCEIENARRNELGDEDAGVAKPKVRRRRNRTGFPVKKKKKARRDFGAAPTPSVAASDEPQPPILQPLPSLSEETKSETDAQTSAVEGCPLMVKNEVTADDGAAEDEISLASRAPPVLSAVKVKSEVMSEDEGRELKRRPLTQAAKKMKHESSNSAASQSRSAPSRSSIRINVKQQLRAKELKRIKRKEKSAATKKTSGRTLRPALAKAAKQKQLENRRRHDKREIRAKSGSDAVKAKDESKDAKLKEETDKDELSDDSVKCPSQKKNAAPKKRRKFIPAGLFSEYYKEDRNVAPDLKNRFTPYKPEDHPHGLLPPPPYFEDWVRRRRVDFKLPYDLWWLHTHDQLPGRDVVESWKYKRIRLNVYYDVKPTNVYETQACNCVIPTEKNQLGCGDDCINRVVYAECSPQLCPLKERCSNQRIQKHDGNLKLSKFMTADKGIGVKTERPIKAGEYILEYVGEVVTDKEFKKRMTSLYKNDIHHYCLNLDGGLVIDGHRMGSDGRFVNHSCEPNCEIQKWSVNGLFRMALFAQRDVEAGEELTYDYNFALFNPEEGQPCRCGSNQCRGVIGGKSQRVTIGGTASATVTDSGAHTASNAAANNATGKKSRVRPRKQVRKRVTNVGDAGGLHRRDSDGGNGVRVLPHRNVHHSIPMTPLTADEKKVVSVSRWFLPRNLTKVRRVQERAQQLYNKENSNSLNQNGKCAKSKQSVEFLMQLNALSKQRFIKTRGLAQVEDNPEMTKTLQLANSLRTIYNFVVAAKDETSGQAFSAPFMTLPSKRKLPIYHQRIGDPIDLSTIEKNIITGVYTDVGSFDKDMNKLIMNNVKYYGRTSDYGIAAVRLRKEYNIAKLQYIPQIEEITGQPIPASFKPVQEDPGDEDEDVIRCICGLYNDEGLMIQCERCLVWQHCGCVGADSAVEHYYCERCSAREVDYEIPLDVEPPDQPAPQEKHYLTLMRDDLQIRLGDTVYVLRDIPNPETGSRHTFRTIKTFKYEDCDIYRVEQLWKTKDGEKFSFGHHYLRPHETVHEERRKFYPNEVVKRLLYETVPLDLIMGRCYVLDPKTYCKGRPIDSDPEHIYICEYKYYRVDGEKKKSSRFTILKSKQQFSVCTKNYAFEKYDTRLRPSRNYAPHGDVRPTTSSHIAAMSTVTKLASNHKARQSKCKEGAESSRVTDAPAESSSTSVKGDDDDLPLARIKDSKLDKQKQRLNTLLLKLLARKSTKAPLDASYLLDMGRRNRKKSTQPTTPATNTTTA